MLDFFQGPVDKWGFALVQVRNRGVELGGLGSSLFGLLGVLGLSVKLCAPTTTCSLVLNYISEVNFLKKKHLRDLLVI